MRKIVPHHSIVGRAQIQLNTTFSPELLQRPHLAVNPYAVVEVPPLVGLERDLQRVGEARDQSALHVGEEGDMMLQRIFIKHS